MAHAWPVFRWLDSRFLLILIFFNGINVLDALTTHVGIAYCGYHEVNAYFLRLLTVSEPLAYVLKILMIGAFTLVLYRSRFVLSQRKGGAFAGPFLLAVTLFCTVFLLLVVLSNTVWISACYGG